jgi:hypothetical protein
MPVSCRYNDLMIDGEFHKMSDEYCQRIVSSVTTQTRCFLNRMGYADRNGHKMTVLRYTRELCLTG